MSDLALLTQICSQAKIKWETINACQKMISPSPEKNLKMQKKKKIQLKSINFVLEMLFQYLVGIVVHMPHVPISFQWLNPLLDCLLPSSFHE